MHTEKYRYDTDAAEREASLRKMEDTEIVDTITETEAETEAATAVIVLPTPSKQKKRSKVWDHFVKAPEGGKYECLKCHKLVVAKGGNTTNLFFHLKRIHKLDPRTNKDLSRVMADHEYENQSGCNEQALLEQGLILPIEMNVQQSSNGRTTYSSSTDNSKCKLVQYEQMDEFDNFCMSLAPKIRRIHGHNPKLAAELQFRIQEQVYMKEAEIYT